MNELALFAGAGGGILGGKLLGWRTVCAVEYDCYAANVLLQRQNDGILQPFPVWDDVRTFDGKPWRGIVDVVSGGFPCQDISAAGKGKGIDGERSGLWSEMARIIGEVMPRYVFVENSPVLTSRGLGRVLRDLAAMGFDARWGVLGAVHSGAPHKRERIWVVAHHDGLRELQPQGSEQEQRGWSGNCGEDVADSIGIRREEGWTEPTRSQGGSEVVQCGAYVPDSDSIQHESGAHAGCRKGQGENVTVVSSDAYRQRREKLHPPPIPGETRQPAGVSHQRRGETWWATEPDVGRVAHGVADRVDRLKALGNGQVPAVAALAWRVLSGEQ